MASISSSVVTRRPAWSTRYRNTANGLGISDTRVSPRHKHWLTVSNRNGSNDLMLNPIWPIRSNLAPSPLLLRRLMLPGWFGFSDGDTYRRSRPRPFGRCATPQHIFHGKLHATFTRPSVSATYGDDVMRWAFVLQLGSQTKAPPGSSKGGLKRSTPAGRCGFDPRTSCWRFSASASRPPNAASVAPTTMPTTMTCACEASERIDSPTLVRNPPRGFGCLS